MSKHTLPRISGRLPKAAPEVLALRAPCRMCGSHPMPSLNSSTLERGAVVVTFAPPRRKGPAQERVPYIRFPRTCELHLAWQTEIYYSSIGVAPQYPASGRAS